VQDQKVRQKWALVTNALAAKTQVKENLWSRGHSRVFLTKQSVLYTGRKLASAFPRSGASIGEVGETLT